MIKTTAHFFTKIMQRWMPDAFVFAILLTFLVLFSGIIFENKSVTDMSLYWGDGVWNLLSFSMQMVVILVTGHILANTRLVDSILSQIARIGNSPTRAIIVTTMVATSASWLNWGFGLVVGALIARKIAENSRGVHFPLLVAAAYSGFIVWHAGLSGSIPLKIATPGNDSLGQLLHQQAIPVSETIFSWPVILIVVLLFISLPALLVFMQPDKNEVEEVHIFSSPESNTDNTITSDREPAQKTLITPAQKIEHSFLLTAILGSLGLFYLFIKFNHGEHLNLNNMNLLLLSLGLLLQGSPRNYLNAMDKAIRCVSGIVLQFPLYAGIMGMMVGSGLATSMSQWFVQISNADTFPVYTFLSAGIINFFVPSGGGQWAVQAPIVIPAAQALGVPLNQAAMAVAFGDAWTNLIQPFWALPLLGIAGISVQKIMGYCTVVLIWSGIVIASGLVLFY